MTDRTQPMTEQEKIEFLESQVEGLKESFSSLADVANTVPALKARIAELEANEKAYEEIIGKKTFREVAYRIRELESELASCCARCEILGSISRGSK